MRAQPQTGLPDAGVAQSQSHVFRAGLCTRPNVYTQQNLDTSRREQVAWVGSLWVPAAGKMWGAELSTEPVEGGLLRSGRGSASPLRPWPTGAGVKPAQVCQLEQQSWLCLAGQMNR